MKKIVIDASVSLKWYLEDEEKRNKALKLLKAISLQKIQPIIPTLWIYEIVNGFRSAVLKKRISNDEAKQYTNEIKSLQFPLKEMTSHGQDIIQLALKYYLSAYDASYVTLAQINQCPFVTGDKSLYNSIKKKLNFVDWIGNY